MCPVVKSCLILQGLLKRLYGFFMGNVELGRSSPPSVGIESLGSGIYALRSSVLLEKNVAQWIKCYETSPWLLVSMLMLLWGFLLFLLCGESEPPRLQTSSANQIWRAIQPVDVWWSRDYPAAVSITSLKRKYAIGARIKNLSFVLVHGTKANIFFCPIVSVCFT